MFTGIIEARGEVRSIEAADGSAQIDIAAPFADDLVLGQSVAIDGACLTVEARVPGGFAVSAIETTLSRTIIGSYEVGSVVNLERAAKIGDRLDGHLVQGHVDGLGDFLGVEDLGDTKLLDFSLPEDVFGMTILHGSITLNGISLTVNELGDHCRCQVAIIPFTWSHTNLSRLVPGDRVNVEGDLIGKYVQRVVTPWSNAESASMPGGADLHPNPDPNAL